MYLPFDRLRVEITTKGCAIPQDERERLQTSLGALAETVKDFPDPALWINTVYHPRSQRYNVELKLKLPGQTLITGEEDPYLDSALQRGVQKLLQETQVYTEHPDLVKVAAAERRETLDREVVAPEAPDAGPLAEAVQAGNYRVFRTALAGYEEWLRKRVGRLVQRRPEAQAQVGKQLRLGDVVEEVYLHAFEQFTHRPTALPLNEWLESLIDPSILAVLRHPAEEREAASWARTVRDTSLP